MYCEILCKVYCVKYYVCVLGLPGGSVAKNLPDSAGDVEMLVGSLGREETWRRPWQPTPVILPGESHGWRSLAGFSPGGHKQLGMTEVT